MKQGGYIYAIGVEGCALVKIGSTKMSVEKRLKNLQTGQPFRLFVMASIAIDGDTFLVEKYIHRHFAAQRRRGEWFDISIDAGTLMALAGEVMQPGIPSVTLSLKALKHEQARLAAASEHDKLYVAWEEKARQYELKHHIVSPRTLDGPFTEKRMIEEMKRLDRLRESASLSTTNP